MTVTNFDSKSDSTQATSYFPLVRVVDLLAQMNDIQTFICSGALIELPAEFMDTLNQRQFLLLSEVSTIVFQNNELSKPKN